MLFSFLTNLLFRTFFNRAVAQTEDFAAAVAAGKVSVVFRGKGGSSGDVIEATIRTTSKAGGDLVLTIAPGTRLQNRNAGEQSMVIASVRGEVVDAIRFNTITEMRIGQTSKTFILDAYCTDLEKDNPSSGTQFSLGKVDPVLACILGQSSCTKVKQAAVWIYTDKANYSHVNQKFDVTQADWDAAKAIVQKCSVNKRN